MGYVYHPMHMHLHCGHQIGASMESHMYNAKQLGMQYIRFTPHDTRTGPLNPACNTFDFSCGSLMWEFAPEYSCGWEAVCGEPNAVFEDGAMIWTESGDADEYKGSGYKFVCTDKHHMRSLLADVTLKLGFDLQLQGDARLILDVSMCQRPPDHLPAHLCYVIGDTNFEKEPHTAVIPKEISADGHYTLNLTEDVQKEGIKDIVGGLDNAFATITVKLEAKNGGSVTCKLYNFDIESKYQFDEVIQRQRVVGDEVGFVEVE